MSLRLVVSVLFAALRVPALCAQVPSAADTVPRHYSILFQQGPLRVLKFAGAHGEKTSLHSHPPHFAYVIKGGLVRFTYPDGRSIDAPLKTGQTLQLARPLTHSIEVLAADSVIVLVMEYAPADSSARAPPPSRSP